MAVGAMKGGAAPDVVASGEALSLAQRWLGIKDLDAALTQTPDPVLEPRPVGLGLGARFLPHNKAAALTAPLAKRLRQASQQDGNGLVNKRQRRDAAGDGPAEGLGVEFIDEEEQGRAGVFQKRAAAEAPSLSAHSQIEQQESTQLQRRKKKKKKKKKRKKQKKDE